MQNLLSAKDVSELLQVSQATLSRWRTARTGPAHVNLNGIPRYRPEDVARWVEGKRE